MKILVAAPLHDEIHGRLIPDDRAPRRPVGLARFFAIDGHVPRRLANARRSLDQPCFVTGWDREGVSYPSPAHFLPRHYQKDS